MKTFEIKLTYKQITTIKAALINDAINRKNKGQSNYENWDAHQSISEQVSDQTPDNIPPSKREYPQ